MSVYLSGNGQVDYKIHREMQLPRNSKEAHGAGFTLLGIKAYCKARMSSISIMIDE